LKLKGQDGPGTAAQTRAKHLVVAAGPDHDGAVSLGRTYCHRGISRALEPSSNGASGDVHVFQAAEGVRLQSIWAKIEYPSLSRNPAVNFIYHVVGGE